MEAEAATLPNQDKGFTGAQVALIVLLAVLLAAGGTYWFVRTYVFPKEFKPVALSVKEEQVLENKLRRLEGLGPAARQSDVAEDADDAAWLRPEAYSEAGANRRIEFSERELNGLIARDPQWANKVAIDLADGLASARALINVDPDFPLIGGKTLRVNAGVELNYANGRPVVILKGVSIMGVPIPNDWMGNLKNVDLVSQFGGGGGFWQAFAAGVESLSLEDGQLVVQLRE